MKATIQITEANPQGVRVIVDGNNVDDGFIGPGGTRTYEAKATIELREYGVDAPQGPTDGESSTPGVAATPAHDPKNVHVGTDAETAGPAAGATGRPHDGGEQ